MRDVIERAEARRRRERGESRPEHLVHMRTLGGGHVLCPAASLGVAAGEDKPTVRGDEWLVSSAAVDAKEVR